MTNLTPPDPISPDPISPDPISPDPISPVPAGSAAAPPPRKGAVTSITVAAAIVGALALASAGGGAAFAATGQIATGATASGISVDATGMTRVNLDAAGASVTIRYGDVTQATLRSVGPGNADWTMRRDGDALDVRSPRAVFGWWIGGWFQDGPTITLTLPKDLEGRLNADLTLESGSLDAAGDFDAVTATVSAGSLTVSGSIADLDLTVDAGQADVSAADTSSVALTMSAGRVNADITGSQPHRVSLDVSAGSMAVTLPAGSYDLTRDVSAGTVDSELSQAAGSAHRVSAKCLRGERDAPSGALSTDFVIAPPSGKVLEVDKGL